MDPLKPISPDRCYSVVRACKIVVTKNKVRFLDWIDCWAAGLVDYGVCAW